MTTLTEREELIREINGLKESIRVAWTDMVSKPMAPAERQELRQSLGTLVHDLNNLRTKLDQLSKA
jgi:flagellar hook-associated protein FlgK